MTLNSINTLPFVLSASLMRAFTITRRTRRGTGVKSAKSARGGRLLPDRSRDSLETFARFRERRASIFDIARVNFIGAVNLREQLHAVSHVSSRCPR